MPRLPQPGGDAGNWGDILNEYLSAAHQGDGSLKDIPQSKVTGLTADLAAKEPAGLSNATKAELSNTIETVGDQRYDLGRSAIDATLLPDGLLTRATKGVFVGVSGDAAADAVIDDGALVFRTDAEGGGPGTGWYVHLETPDAQTVQYMRALIEYPSDASMNVTLVIPGDNWIDGGVTAALHATITCRLTGTPTARIASGGYGSGVNVAERNRTTTPALPGRTVDIEVWANKTTGRTLIYQNGAKWLEYTDIDAIAHMDKWGIIEINGEAPGDVSPRILLFEIGSDFNPPAELATSRASSNVSSAVSLTGSFADINSGVYAPVVFPPTGQVVIIANCFVEQSAGKTQLRVTGDGVNGTTVTVVATGAFSGQVTYIGMLTGTPGKRVDAKLQALHSDGGTATIRPQSESGPITMVALGADSYTPGVES